jgi:integrase
MATIKFYIQSNKNPAGIYVRLREGRTIDAKAKTKYAINPNDWSEKKGQPINLKDADFKKLNEELSGLRSKLLTHYNNSVGAKGINSIWLKEFISPSVKAGAIPDKLVEYFDYYALHKKSTVEASTHTKLKVNKHWIERFQKATNKEYFIKDVNADFKLNFEDYCLSEGYAQNTIARAIRFIKTICYHARNNGIETHFQLNGISTKNEKVEKIVLSVQEIDLIQKCELTYDYLENARDWLIISCETGQRVSDFLNFNKEQICYKSMLIKGKKVNLPFIEFTQLKTKKRMVITLTKRVLKILDKRDGNFPRKISSQHYNEYIKTVCKQAGLCEKVKGSKVNKETNRKESGFYPKYELVASHIGRRSFATNNYGNIPTSLLMSMTGHSTEKMFLEYIGKTETEQAMQLAEYFYLTA